MKPRSGDSYWRMLERGAHRPEVQEQIRRAIRDGTIRVAPGRNGGLRIIPVEPGAEPPLPRRTPPDLGLPGLPIH